MKLRVHTYSVKSDINRYKIYWSENLWPDLIGMIHALIAVLKNKITDLILVAKNHIAVVSDLGPHF
jgi:hypothetical protein